MKPIIQKEIDRLVAEHKGDTIRFRLELELLVTMAEREQIAELIGE